MTLKTYQWPQGVALPERIFALSDIHGCAEELKLMLRHLVEHENIGPNDWVVFIGDYIDRGPNSRAVITRLIAFKRQHRRCIFLSGNHEDLLYGYLGFTPDDDPGCFLRNGGRETLKSYGTTSCAPRDEIIKAFPKSHLQFLRRLGHVAIIGDFVFAHSGLNWSKSLEEQNERDVWWHRKPWYQHTHSLGKTIVHGHTPQSRVVFQTPYEINVDTGCAYDDDEYGRCLSCVEVQTGQVFQVKRGAHEVTSYRAELAVLPVNDDDDFVISMDARDNS